MELTFNWTTAALVSVPSLLCWLAFVLWRPQPITEYIYDETVDDLVPLQQDTRPVCDRCGQHADIVTRFNSPYSTWDELVCDDCLSQPLTD